MKLQKLFNFGLIPNHPDINTKILTHTIDKLSKNNCPKEKNGSDLIVLLLGIPNVKKSACTTNIRNIATIRSNSMLLCLASLFVCIKRFVSEDYTFNVSIKNFI